jgi:hypothetical protein
LIFDWKAAFARQQALEKPNLAFATVPPKPFFKELKADGKVLIGFQSDVYIVPNLQMINNGTLYLSDLQTKRDLMTKRELGVTTRNNN